MSFNDLIRFDIPHTEPPFPDYLVSLFEMGKKTSEISEILLGMVLDFSNEIPNNHPQIVFNEWKRLNDMGFGGTEINVILYCAILEAGRTYYGF